jgi:hypothetical protein
MTSKGDHSRRIWKLQAVKAFASREVLSLWDIRKAIGHQELDALFNQGFLTHPADPVAGAVLVKENLHKRFGKSISKANTRVRPTARKA